MYIYIYIHTYIYTYIHKPCGCPRGGIRQPLPNPSPSLNPPASLAAFLVCTYETPGVGPSIEIHQRGVAVERGCSGLHYIIVCIII